MATINLGNIKFKWQGAYNGATAYTVDDVVSYNGSSYICIANSTGNLPTDTSYFEQMSSAGTNGTNGTDLTTTLTTQGDLVCNSVSNAGWVGHWNSQNWTDFGYFANQNNSGNLQGSSEITIYRPLDTNQFCMMSWNSKMWDNPTSLATFDGVIAFNTTGNGAMSGITFGMYQFGAGNVYFDKIQIYGIK
jgi:hypothetical protein